MDVAAVKTRMRRRSSTPVTPRRFGLRSGFFCRLSCVPSYPRRARPQGGIYPMMPTTWHGQRDDVVQLSGACLSHINHAPAGEFNKVLADFLIVGQCSEPHTFAGVVLGGHCETKALIIGGHCEPFLIGNHGRRARVAHACQITSQNDTSSGNLGSERRERLHTSMSWTAMSCRRNRCPSRPRRAGE